MFETPSLVRNVLARIDYADQSRSINRGRINNLFNGEPPYTVEEAAENNIEWNFNTKQAAKVAHDARARLATGLMQPARYFSIRLDEAPVHRKAEYEAILSEEINRVMKRSQPYSTVMREGIAQVTLHGVGPVFWPDKYCWRPRTIGIYDLKIPSNTYTSFDNLEYFGLYREFTPGELFKLTHGEKVDAGWNMKAVDATIKWCMEHTDGYTQGEDSFGMFYTNPERFWERFRANMGYWASDVPQKIIVYDFFFRHVKSTGDHWQRRMILQKPLDGMAKENDLGEEFLYNPQRIFANNLQEILHCLYADYNNVAPFYYHSVRGLGYLLYDLCHALNRLQCKITESAFEQLLMYFYAGDPADRDRLDKLDLHHLGMIPDGLKIVPNTERYSPNQQLVGSAVALNQGSLNQNSSSFTNDAALSDDKTQTLGEWSSKLSIYNQMVSSTLALAYEYQKYQYAEIGRRFCLKHSQDKDVVEFQRNCVKRGLPKVYLNSKRWDIIPERVLGGGNQALAIQQASAVYEVRPALSPMGQRLATHDYVLAVTGDPGKATAMSPVDDEARVSDPTHDAELAFGTLMNGVMISVRNDAAHIETIEAMIGMLNAVVQNALNSGGNPGADRVLGMQTVSAFTWQHIQMLSQDRTQKAKVKEYSDNLGRLDNQIKAFAQRAAEQNGNGMSPEIEAKMQADLIKAQTQARIKEAAASQRLQQREQQFESEQQRKELTTAAELALKQAEAQQDQVLADAEAAAKIRRQRFEQP